MSVLDRLARLQANRPQGGMGGRVKGVFHAWKEGPNRVRLAGDFLEVRTHYIAPSATRKDRGLCIAAAFQGDDRIPQVVNCQDWDIQLERPKKEKTCPICRLNAIARAVLTEGPSDEEKKFFEALRSATRATSNLKWNVLDRDDPFVIIQENGADKKVLGFKIASIGPEATKDILGIFKQVGYDIQDPERGIDLEVIKDSKGARTTYSARAVVEGVSLKVTPFTAEERALDLNDLKIRCGKLVDVDKIVDALHEDLREILSINVAEAEDVSVEAELEAAVAEVSDPGAEVSSPVATQKVAQKTAPAASSPKTNVTPQRPVMTGKAPASVLDRFQKKAAAPSQTDAGDEDSVLGGTDAKKK